MDTMTTHGSVVLSESKRRALTEDQEQVALDMVRALMGALGAMQKYPTLNPIILDKIDETKKHLTRWLRTFQTFEAVSLQGNLQVNNAVLSMQCQEKDFVQAFIFYLTERNVRTLVIKRGMKDSEIKHFVEFFSKPAKTILKNRNIPRALKRLGVKKIEISSELVLDAMVFESNPKSALAKKLSQLNTNELLEKANILSQLDMDALTRVGDLATVVTNLRYTKNQEAADQILSRLSDTLHDDDPAKRLASANTFSRIADSAVDYTLFSLHSEVGDVLAKQAATENDPRVFSELSKGLEKAAQVHIAKGDYDQAMKIVESLGSKGDMPGPNTATLKRQAESSLTRIASPESIRKMVTTLDVGTPDDRDRAVEMLSQIGTKVASDVVDLIYTADSREAMAAAIETLRRIGEPVLPELYVELGEEMSDEYRAAFIRVVGLVGNIHSVKKLMPYLIHEDESVSEASYRALCRIGGPAAETLCRNHLTEDTVPKAFFRRRILDFGKFKNETTVPALIEFMQGKGPFTKYLDPELQIEAARALGEIGSTEAIEGLTGLVLHKKGLFGRGGVSEELKVAACYALRKIGNPCAKPALDKACCDKSNKIRAAAKSAIETLNRRAEEKARVEAYTVGPTIPPKAPTPPPDMPDKDETTVIGISDPELAATEMTLPATEMNLPEEPQAVVARITSSSAEGVKIVLVVGPIIVDGVKVVIPGFDDEGKLTADQQGAAFDLQPGQYQVLIQDKGMNVEKTIAVQRENEIVRLDLQDIFNF
jgi:HEAT repeat protein